MKIFEKIKNDLSLIISVINQYSFENNTSINKFEFYVLCLEDRRFFSHKGFDLWSIGRAIFRWGIGRNGGGASTIEQQLVRTITGDRKKSLKRKLKEIILAYFVSRRFMKIQLLKTYLEIAFMGSGIVGIHDATLKIKSNLSDSTNVDFKGAYFASLLLYPKPLNASPNWNKNIVRRANYAIHIEEMLKKGVKISSWIVGSINLKPFLASKELITRLEDKKSRPYLQTHHNQIVSSKSCPWQITNY